MHDAVKCQHSSKQNHHKFVTAKGAAPAAVTGTPDVPDKICCPLQCDWGRNEVCQKAAGSRTEMWKFWGCGQRVGMDKKCALKGFVWLRESRHTEEDKSLKTDCPMSWEIPRELSSTCPQPDQCSVHLVLTKQRSYQEKCALNWGSKERVWTFSMSFPKIWFSLLFHPARGLYCHIPFLWNKPRCSGHCLNYCWGNFQQPGLVEKLLTPVLVTGQHSWTPWSDLQFLSLWGLCVFSCGKEGRWLIRCFTYQ